MHPAAFATLTPTMTVTVRGHRVFVYRAGAGPPLLLLHGVPDTHAVWLSLLPYLTPHYTCYAPDWPGFGRSEEWGRELDCSPDGHADTVLALAEALGIAGAFALGGHDIGGISAMAFAAEHPARLTRLLVANAGFSPRYRWHAWARVWRTPLLGEASLAVMNRPLFAASLRRGSRKLTAAQIDAAYAAVTPAMKRTVLRIYRALDPVVWRGWDTRLRAAVAQVPTVVAWGAHDPYFPAWMPHEIGVGARVTHFPDSGHWVVAEEPAGVAAAFLAP